MAISRSITPSIPSGIQVTKAIQATSEFTHRLGKFFVAAFMVMCSLITISTLTAPAYGQFDFPGGLGGGGNEDPITWNATYKLREGTDEGVIEIEATLGSGWHIYSTTQPAGGPIPTSFKVESPKGASISSAFKPDHAPKKSISDVYDGLTIEEFADRVVWTAPIVLPPGYSGDIKIAADGLTCTDVGKCIPVRDVLTVKFDGRIPNQMAADTPANTGAPKPVQLKPYREGDYVVVWTAETSGPIEPGKSGYIQFTAKPDPTFHVYPAAVDDAKFSTNFGVTKKSDLKLSKPTTKNPIVSHEEAGFVTKFHEGDVTWRLPVTVPSDAKPGERMIQGMIQYQACTTSACQRPTALKFTTKVSVGPGKSYQVVLEKASRGDALDAANGSWVDDGKEKPTPALADDAVVAPTDPASAAAPNPNAHASTDAAGHDAAGHDAAGHDAKEAAPLPIVTTDSPEAIAEMAKLYDPNHKISYLTLADMEANPVGSGGTSLGNKTTFWSAMFGAFVGGILLNLMPCVFPVLGLKVMGFVKQAGSDPAKIRMHGIAFTLGLLVAMWVLAGIILALKYSLGQSINWGAQMGNPYFVCSMIVLLFVLGLNMAGVFEIGTSMTRVGGAVQGKEGYSSSFLSGVLTTLIATPCSGPFLGAAMSYTLAQTAGVAMFLFTVFALGISLPYLLLSFFPALINKLPKPGAWMETFKVTMAFALFATVAFFMQAFGGQTGTSGLAWLAMALVVIGLAAYYYGNFSQPHIPSGKRISCGYVLPLVIAGVGGWMCYGAASERSQSGGGFHAGGLAWQNWNPGKVEYTLASSGKPIWVDYTADW